MQNTVLLPYRFTLFSNYTLCDHSPKLVLLPYRFTLFSNFCPSLKIRDWFYYLIDLHYSQTTKEPQHEKWWFYYLIDLHYSQTDLCTTLAPLVLLPYRFTLFSNEHQTARRKTAVLLPYRFTLFSNNWIPLLRNFLSFTTL